MKQNLIINPELKALIPPLLPDELAQLKANILKDGIREPIVTWNETIVDGHNRYAIAEEFELPFETKALEFESINHVKIWMAQNALGRRNLPVFVKLELATIIEENQRAIGREKYNKTVGRPTKESLSIMDNDFGQKEERHNTQKIVADEVGVGTGTKARFDVVRKKAPEEIKDKLRQGEVSINQAYQQIKKEEKIQQRQERRAEINERIEELPIKASNIRNGDSLQILSELPDGCIDIVITDPPYGISYHSNRSIYDDSITKRGLANDGRNEALKLLDDMCKLLQSKTAADAHLYIFTNWKMFTEFEHIIGKYFDIKTPIVWDKGNKGSGDLDNDWGNQTEIIIYAVKGKKYVNVRRGNIISVPRLHNSVMVHPTQKPDEVIKQLMEVSYKTGDFIVDPFMGSGATIKVCNQMDAKCLGIELDEEMYKIANHYIYG